MRPAKRKDTKRSKKRYIKGRYLIIIFEWYKEEREALWFLVNKEDEKMKRHQVLGVAAQKLRSEIKKSGIIDGLRLDIVINSQLTRC